MCTDGALEMFKEAVQEFYTSLFEKINHVIATEGNDTNVSSLGFIIGCKYL